MTQQFKDTEGDCVGDTHLDQVGCLSQQVPSIETAGCVPVTTPLLEMPAEHLTYHYTGQGSLSCMEVREMDSTMCL